MIQDKQELKSRSRWLAAIDRGLPAAIWWKKKRIAYAATTVGAHLRPFRWSHSRGLGRAITSSALSIPSLFDSVMSHYPIYGYTPYLQTGNMNTIGPSHASYLVPPLPQIGNSRPSCNRTQV